MIRLAHERVGDLFELAAGASARGEPELAVRYVRLARAVGMRYNVRIPPSFRDRYCRHCSTYSWEGRTVRTRVRAGRTVRTCLVCGRVARRPLGVRRPARERPGRFTLARAGHEAEAVVAAADVEGVGDLAEGDEEEDD